VSGSETVHAARLATETSEANIATPGIDPGLARSLRWQGIEAVGLDMAGLALDPLRVVDARAHHCRFDAAIVRATIASSVLCACTFAGTTFIDADLAHGTRIEGSSFRGSTWRGGTVSARLVACELTHLEADGIEFAPSAHLVQCRLGGRFVGCAFGGTFLDCDLQDAEFTDCTFQGARFERCRLPDGVLLVADWHALSARARARLADARLEPAARVACTRWLEARLARAHRVTDDLVDARDLAARLGPATGTALFKLLA
jgi:uncharacterized protein YjbI with pentapeptide repeats